jgi:hypothetical protein
VYSNGGVQGRLKGCQGSETIEQALSARGPGGAGLCRSTTKVPKGLGSDTAPAFRTLRKCRGVLGK